MGFLKRDDDNQAGQAARAGAGAGSVTEEAPHAATYEAGSLAGIPASGRERIARMIESSLARVRMLRCMRSRRRSSQR